MPTLAGLINHAVMGDLATLQPILSPHAPMLVTRPRIIPTGEQIKKRMRRGDSSGEGIASRSENRRKSHGFVSQNRSELLTICQ